VWGWCLRLSATFAVVQRLLILLLLLLVVETETVLALQFGETGQALLLCDDVSRGQVLH
jgi:hypothetical protein